MRLLIAFLLAAPACAQKPPDVTDPHPRRADSVVSRVEVLAAADADSAITVQSVFVHIGETPVEIRISERPCERDCWSAINVHDDEDTAVEAGLAVLRREGGRLVELRHGGTRNLGFRLGGEAFTVDPNRIFTDAGRARTLASLSRDTPAARAAVAAFADTLLAIYGRPVLVLALHNNTEDNYSAASYAPGGTEAREAAEVRLTPGTDPDDFVFVTDPDLYRSLLESQFNVVLQNNDAMTDDGSLSVWAAQNGLRYANVEAQHGHLEADMHMIDALVGSGVER